MATTPAVKKSTVKSKATRPRPPKAGTVNSGRVAAGPLRSPVPADTTEFQSWAAALSEGFSTGWWRRYNNLVSKRERELITHDELVELTALTNSLEDHNVQRMAWLSAAAGRRGIPLSELVASLELKPPQSA